MGASAVKEVAIELDVPVHQPPTLRAPEAIAALTATPLDVLVVAAYGLILPQPVLAWPRHGCLNIHASLLPRWRGAAPIARAIEAGDRETGITLMQMDAGLDTGPIVARAPLSIEAADTTGALTERLADLGARMAVEMLAMLERDDSLPASPQPAAGVTYAPKIGRADTLLDWNAAAPLRFLRRRTSRSPSMSCSVRTATSGAGKPWSSGRTISAGWVLLPSASCQLSTSFWVFKP